MAAKDYPYAHGNLLEDRNTYFYSGFQGIEFLQAWKLSRETILNNLPEPLNYALGNNDFIYVIDSQEFDTEKLLEMLFVSKDIKENNYLKQLLQRFEVSKRIYARYNSNFRAVKESSYDDMHLYIRFAEVLERAYDNTGNIIYINTLLKCIDTLCALRERLNYDEKRRLAWLILQECKHINSICDKKGIGKNLW